jgi:hypothetical protein
LVSGTAVGRNLGRLPLSLLEKPFELIDVTTGASVPYQIVTIDDPRAPQPWAAARYAMGANSQLEDGVRLPERSTRVMLSFVAHQVPAMGYRTYRLVPAEDKPALGATLSGGENWLESRFYRIEVDPDNGAVTSLFDKELEREWVDREADYGLNQLLVRSLETGEVSVARPSRVERGKAGPVCQSLVIQSVAFGVANCVQEIVLYQDLKRIDFNSRVLKDVTASLEGYFAYPFAVDSPRFRYEASNAVIEPIVDQLPGSNTDAYPMQHWVRVGDDQGSVVWSSIEAPVVELGGLWPSPVSQAHHGVTSPEYGRDFLRDPSQLERGHVYSYAIASNFRTNFQPVQTGDMLFRYAMTTQSSDLVQSGARDFGWSVSTPLVPVSLSGGQEGTLSPAGSFCQVDQPNVMVLAIKGAEDGDGLIVRLAETEGRDTTVTVRLPHVEIDQAVWANNAEEDQGTLAYGLHSVRVPVRARGLMTIRCRGTARWPKPNRVAYH